MPNPFNDITFIRQTQHIQNRPNLSPNRNKEQLEKACKEFESLFVNYMMQQMRRTIPEDGLISRSQGEKIYTGMLDNEVAKSVSHSRGIGLARVMYEQMTGLQGNEPKKK